MQAAIVMNNLAMVCRFKGESMLEEAETLLQQALQIRRCVNPGCCLLWCLVADGILSQEYILEHLTHVWLLYSTILAPCTANRNGTAMHWKCTVSHLQLWRHSTTGKSEATSRVPLLYITRLGAFGHSFSIVYREIGRE